jgi:ERCC4-related helicase
MTPYHSQYWATLLTLREPPGSIEGLSRSISNARVDLNPHQVDAALFALRSPLSRGVILADEVGLGKTIEAGIVLSQRWAERRRKILLIVPSTLRKQWQQEMDEKFYLPTIVLDSKSFAFIEKQGIVNPFDQSERIVIVSCQFAAAKAEWLRRVPWDLVVIDEAHRLRNVFKPSSKIARAISESLREVPKLLLTATPLQNSLMELYGLTSVIDDHLFGDPATFRDNYVRAADEVDRNRDLRERIRSICTRTLRKQVVEYVPFTRRVPITQDFIPTDEEHRLYEEVSNFLQRDLLISLPSSQRTLLTLVLRKLLSSSSFAIAGTLHRLIARLEKMTDNSELLDDEDLDGIDELADELREAESSPEDAVPRVDPKRLAEELIELRRSAALADSIPRNSKGEALLPALATAFRKAEELGAQKAVVFTESRRTQLYLFDLLSANGYEGQLVLMNGSNTDTHSKLIYQRWLSRHQGQDMITGSKPIDIKAAIVEEFRDHATIMIATESAAEGVNLQFCSLVVNFDLPWNPQRIEQRIGRCHRYGQRHDVVVVNFLNRRNQADQRVFELLSEKFRLFDGVFGASDEVLGALESGVDVERRIAQVYQKCRSPEEIAAAFDKLQSELEEQIQARMTSTRQVLIEQFDQEVTDRLRFNRDRTVESLSDRERWLLSLTREETDGSAEFDPAEARFHYQGQDGPEGPYDLDWKRAEANGDHFYRQDHSLATTLLERALARRLAPAHLQLDYAAHGFMVSVLEPLRGTSGWLELTKLTVESIDFEESLIIAGQTDAGEQIDAETCGKLLKIPARIDSTATLPPSPDLAPPRDQAVASRLRAIQERNATFFDEEVLKLDRWSDDLKQGLERELKELDRQIREARRTAALMNTLQEKLDAQKTAKSLESERSKKRRSLFEAQDEIDSRRDALIEKIESQLRQRMSIQSLFTIRWTLV